MDRVLVDYSLGGDGSLTQSVNNWSTSGFIPDDAAHWAIEPFIPIEPSALVQHLIMRGELSDAARIEFRRACETIDASLHDRSRSYHRRWSAAYSTLDPDCDFRKLNIPASPISGDGKECHVDPAQRAAVDEVIRLCDEMVDDAGFRRLSQHEIEACVGVASQWGVPLNVDFELFERLVVYARGDIIGNRLRRRLWRLYRREWVEVPIYQRMVVLFEIRSDRNIGEELSSSALHLRLFKNIPKQDIDMLLPGAKVRISGLDRIKIIAPSLGGLLMSMRKIASYAILFAALALHWSAIAVVLVVGYLVKSVMSYFQTKNKYQLNLNRNLYFQKLDSNAGVGYQLIHQAHQQTMVEMILAYYAIATSDEPISGRRLRRRCERLIREAIDIEIDFRETATLDRLVGCGLVAEQDETWRLMQRQTT